MITQFFNFSNVVDEFMELPDSHILDSASINQVHNRLIGNSSISATWSHAQLICGNAIEKFWLLFGPWDRDSSQQGI